MRERREMRQEMRRKIRDMRNETGNAGNARYTCMSTRLDNHSYLLKSLSIFLRNQGKVFILEIVPFRDGTMPPVRKAISVTIASSSVDMFFYPFASLVCPHPPNHLLQLNCIFSNPH